MQKKREQQPPTDPADAPRPPIPDTATELELKLAVAPEEAARLCVHPLLLAHATGPMRSERMLARYYDTADALLATSRMALRVRREGDDWVQTVKTSSGAALSLSSRGEWEQPLAGPTLDWSALAETPLAQLAGFDALPRRVRCLFTVRFERRSWPLTLPDGTRASASLDAGEIACGRGSARRSAPISEFELEFVAGDPGAVWKFAERLARDLHLTPLAESKGERGHALSTGNAVEPRKTRMPDIQSSQGVHGALASALGAPLSALEHNLRHLDASDIEYVHQARVALRRMRSVLRAFLKLVSDKRLKRGMRALGTPLKELGRRLGAARDADVFIEQTLPAMKKTIGTARAGALPLLDPVAASTAARRDAAYRDVHAWLESRAPGQQLLLAERLVFEAGRAPPARNGKPLDAKLGALLRKQHDEVQRAAEAITRRSAPERHQLRIEVKRLRYLLDIAQALWPRDATKDYRRALEALQEQLGELNDAAVAGETLEALRADAAVRDAWDAHERAQLDADLPRVAQAIAVLDLAPVPWRGRAAGAAQQEKA